MDEALLVEIDYGGEYLLHEVPNLELSQSRLAVAALGSGDGPPGNDQVPETLGLAQLEQEVDVLFVLEEVPEPDNIWVGEFSVDAQLVGHFPFLPVVL